MPYATKNGLIEQFGQAELIQLTDRAMPRTNAIVDAVLDRAIAAAGGEIDSYLAASFAVPIATVPAQLARIAGDITRFRLYDNRATEEVRNRYKDAITWLKDIQSGRASLISDTGVPLDQQTQAISGGISTGSRPLNYTAPNTDGSFVGRYGPQI